MLEERGRKRSERHSTIAPIHYEINTDIKSSLSNACGSGKTSQVKTTAVCRGNDPSSIQQEVENV